MRRRGYRKYHFGNGGKLITNSIELLYTLILLGAYEIDTKIRNFRNKRYLPKRNDVKHFADDFHEGLDGRTSDSQDKYNVIDGGLFESKIINNDRNRYGFPKEEKLYKRRSER